MTYHYYGDKNADIVLIQPVGDHDLPEIENEVAEIKKLTSVDFQLIAVKVDDWNDSYRLGTLLRYLAMRASAMERKTLWRRY